MTLARTEPIAGESIRLRYADESHTMRGVRLVQEIGLPAEALDFAYDDTHRVWRLSLPSLHVRRMEYRFDLTHADGRVETVRDPGNPLLVQSAFGDKSVLELPGYRRPDWLDRPVAPGVWREIAIPSRALRADVPVRIWSPSETAAGVLLAHDGAEFDRLASLGRYAGAMTAGGDLPPHHLVLVSPVERNDWYSANPAYARALVAEVLPRLRAVLDANPVGAAGLPVVALGASLGALALLHAHTRHPHAFAGLFLQSGSFFQHRFDAQESGFARYRRVVRFVAELPRRGAAGSPVPTVLTCGTAEENLANNRDLAAVLGAQGYPVRLVEVPDAHNFTAWRDAWHPHLAELATSAWTGVGAAAGHGAGAPAAGAHQAGGG
jgi:enterochelin esterase family protein